METNVTEALLKLKSKGLTQTKISQLTKTNQSTISRLIRGLPKAYYGKGFRETPKGIETNLRLLNICNNILYGEEVRLVEYKANKPVISSSYRARGSSENKHNQARVPGYNVVFNSINNAKNKIYIGFAGLNEDEKYLISQGIKSTNIVVCDKNDVCLEWSRQNNISVPPQPLCNDFYETMNWAVACYGKNNIANINLDFEGTLRSYIPILWFMKALNLKTTVSITYTCRGCSIEESDKILSRINLGEIIFDTPYTSKAEFSNGTGMFTRIYRT